MESRWSFEIEKPSESSKQAEQPLTETRRSETQQSVDELRLAYYQIDKAVARVAKQPAEIVGQLSTA